MATRSLIGLQTDKGIRAIYCHFDGYPDHVGAILCKYYATAERVEALINLGCICMLGPKLAPDKVYDEPQSSLDGPGLVLHSFTTPHKDVTVAYHRDRGEPRVIFDFHSEFGFNHSVKIPVPYHYLFKGGQWYLEGYPFR